MTINTDISSLLQVIGKTDEAMQKQELLHSHVYNEDMINKVKEKVTKYYSDNGKQVDAETIAESVDYFMQQRLTYKAPKPWVESLGGVYANRGVIAISLAAVTTAGTATVVGMEHLEANRVAAQITAAQNFQRNAEAAIEALSQEFITQEKSIAQYESSDSSIIKQGYTKAKMALLAQENIMEQAKGIQMIKVNEENINVAKASSNSVISLIDKAAVHSATVSDFLNEAGLMEKLEREYAKISKDAKRYEMTSTEWERGFAQMNAGAIKDSNQTLTNLYGLLANMSQLASNMASLEKLYKETSELVSEKKTAAYVNFVYTKNKASLNSGKSVDFVSEFLVLQPILKNAYNLEIMNQKGLRAAYTWDDDETRKTTYYLVMQVKGDDGNTGSVFIQPFEQSQQAFYEKFSIQVAENVYRKVEADFMDNNFVDNNVFGNKPKGSLFPDFNVKVAAISQRTPAKQ